MSSEIDLVNIDELEKDIDNRKRIFGKTMIAICLIGVLIAFAAMILLIVGVVKDNKVCEIVGFALNFIDIFTLGVSLVKTIIKFNTNLKQ